jgi:hypothetical protein
MFYFNVCILVIVISTFNRICEVRKRNMLPKSFLFHKHHITVQVAGVQNMGHDIRQLGTQTAIKMKI